jgi:teichuronic acid biosynthesis glycosyltransferase TuaC
MRILFVRSGNNGIDSISTNQGESLIAQGVEVYYFNILGKGLRGYLSNVLKLREVAYTLSIDLIHAHYSLSGFLSSLSFTKKQVITSLMGSDVLSADNIPLRLTRFFSKNIWARTIVKSQAMKQQLKINSAIVLPNGVNFDLFKTYDKISALKEIGWNTNSKHILFSSDPERPEKNFKLAERSIEILRKQNSEIHIEIHFLKNIGHAVAFKFYNAADVLLLTSLTEGSPNVIKEAMACNCPIVSTPVGDVFEIIAYTNGCYLTTYDPVNIADSLKKAIDFGNRTNGRDNIRHLESSKIALKLIKLYEETLKLK